MDPWIFVYFCPNQHIPSFRKKFREAEQRIVQQLEEGAKQKTEAKDTKLGKELAEKMVSTKLKTKNKKLELFQKLTKVISAHFPSSPLGCHSKTRARHRTSRNG